MSAGRRWRPPPLSPTGVQHGRGRRERGRRSFRASSVGSTNLVLLSESSWGDLLSARSYRSGRLKRQGEKKKGTEEEVKPRSKLKEQEKGENI